MESRGPEETFAPAIWRLIPVMKEKYRKAKNKCRIWIEEGRHIEMYENYHVTTMLSGEKKYLFSI